MTFERGIWAETARNFWANKFVVLTVVALIMGVSVFQDVTHSTSSGGFWAAFAWLPVAVAAHATILKGQSGFVAISGSEFKSVYRPFLWRTIGLSLVGAIPAAAISIPLANRDDKTLVIFLLMSTYGVIESFILAIWGTMLPACVAGGDRSLKAAGVRSTKIFSYVLGRFWGCNAVVLVGGFWTVILVSSAVSVSAKNYPDTKISVAWDYVQQTSLTILLAFNVVLLATILSRAYLNRRGKSAGPKSG